MRIFEHTNIRMCEYAYIRIFEHTHMRMSEYPPMGEPVLSNFSYLLVFQPFSDIVSEMVAIC